MTKKWGSGVVFLAAAALAAVGMGMYVYPACPALVWMLLFVCWACYRLRLRAVAQFGSAAALHRIADASALEGDEAEADPAGAV